LPELRRGHELRERLIEPRSISGSDPHPLDAFVLGVC